MTHHWYYVTSSDHISFPLFLLLFSGPLFFFSLSSSHKSVLLQCNIHAIALPSKNICILLYFRCAYSRKKLFIHSLHVSTETSSVSFQYHEFDSEVFWSSWCTIRFSPFFSLLWPHVHRKWCPLVETLVDDFYSLHDWFDLNSDVFTK